MIRRREQIALFGMSFLDVLFCALGGVVMLLMQTIHSTLQLAETDARLIAVTAEQERLADELAGCETQRDEARAAAARAEEETQRLRDALAEAARENERERLAAAARLTEAQAAATSAQAEAEQANAQLQQARDALAQARQENERALAAATAAMNDAREEAAAAQSGLTDRIAGLESNLAAARAENDRLRGTVRGVLGLRGKMANVAFLFDTSGSMGSAVRGEERFAEYTGLLKAWISTLHFKNLNVIRFYDRVEVIPGWEGVLVEASNENRVAAGKYVDSFQPAGTTNTMGALQYAMQTLDGVDTIVLFSDGQPNAEDGKPGEGEEAIQWILGYVQENNRDAQGNPKATINTVAMGDYFDKAYGEFLRDLAEQNGGVFIGR